MTVNALNAVSFIRRPCPVGVKLIAVTLGLLLVVGSGVTVIVSIVAGSIVSAVANAIWGGLGLRLFVNGIKGCCEKVTKPNDYERYKDKASEERAENQD